LKNGGASVKKCFILVLAGLLLFSFSSVLAAGLKGRIGISGRGGLGFPIGAFADEGSYSTTLADSIMHGTLREKGLAKIGYGFGVAIEYFVTDKIAVGGSFDYQSFGLDAKEMEDEVRSFFPGDGVEIVAKGEGAHRIKSFGVFGKYLFTASPKISPYLKVGLGMGQLSSEFDLVLTASDGAVETALGVNGERESDMKLSFDMGGGVMYRLSQSIWITGEILYTHLAIDGTDGDVDWIGTIKHDGMTEKAFDDKWKDEFDFSADRIDAYLGLSFFFGS
jgi:opacity protein-like surface antigen